jgi:hypothetical protein
VGDEAFLIKWSSLVKKKVLKLSQRPSPDDVLFVDVSGCKTILAGSNEFGEPSPYFRKVVTDRAVLAEFLSFARRYGSDMRLLLLDVLLADSTDADSLLKVQIDSLGDRMLGVSHFQEGKKIVLPAVDMPFALSTYKSTIFLFLKYQLMFRDSIKTVPLVMHERINHVSLQKRQGLFWLDHKPVLAYPIIDYKVLPTDFDVGHGTDDQHFTIYPIGSLLEAPAYMDEADLHALFRDKIVIIGDFQSDIHWTPFDNVPGPLLIYNAYLTLAGGDNVIRPGWLLLLLVGYFILTYRMIKQLKVEHPLWLVRLFESKAGQAVLNTLDEAFILIMITILSYLIFNIHINILILLFFVKIMEFVLNSIAAVLNPKPRSPLLKKSSQT